MVNKIKKRLVIMVVLLLPLLLFGQNIIQHGRLKVTPDGHFITYADGVPFFWMGDTAWEMFHRLSKEQIRLYLDNRQLNGFNVLQVVAAPELQGPDSRNYYGQLPFINNNPATPNDAWFTLIDWTIKEALKRQLFVGLLPTWGDKVAKLWGNGPVVFNENTAYKYGWFLGNRYKKYPNIIWITGGDRPASNDTADWRPVWRAMIKGIRAGTGNHALITYHPSGESSSTTYWNNNDVLDMNMLQSGHRARSLPVWDWISRDFNITPAKPVIDGEPCYEGHPVNWDSRNGYFTPAEVRMQLYRSVFAGGCGVTYGHNAVWQFYIKGQRAFASPRKSWQQALNAPVATQIKYLKNLILSRPSITRVVIPQILLKGQGQGSRHIVAFGDAGHTYAMLYMPAGVTITINLKVINAGSVNLWWYNPQTGIATFVDKKAAVSQLNITSPDGNDWVLVAEQEGRYENKPGQLLN